MHADQIPPFSELGLPDAVLRAVQAVGYEAPTSIQAETIPPLLAGRDLVGQAQTGTGKTAAFALPLLGRLKLELKQPQLLVLAPTRELALQVAEAMQTYARFLKGFRVAPVYGGQSIETQLRQLKRGVHAVVGTPGRVQDHLRRRTLKLDKLQAVVLDEADEMLRMGFLEEVEVILRQTPEEKQVALFSATMPPPIRRVASKYLRDPVEVAIKTATATVDTVTQRYWKVVGVNKLHALTRILEVENFDAMLIFVRTRAATAELSEKLEARGFASAPLSGDMSQALRERTISRLKAKKIDIVVATDVAARGLDVDRISHVLNFDIPYDTEAYVHRIGRTARAGRQGKAILFVSPRERRMFHAIERATGQRIEPMRLPSRKEIADQRLAQFESKIEQTLESRELARFTDWIEDFGQRSDHSLTEIAGALAYLAQGERRLLLDNARESKPSGREDSGRQPRKRREQAVERTPRGDRFDHKSKPRKRDDDPLADVVMQRFRIAVGREHGVEPGNIVGAISNEGEIDGQYIGRIQIFDEHSLVDLPEGMPRDIFRHLQKVRVCGQALAIRPEAQEGPRQRKEHDAEPKKRRPRPARTLSKTEKKKLKRKKLKRKKLKRQAKARRAGGGDAGS